MDIQLYILLKNTEISLSYNNLFTKLLSNDTKNKLNTLDTEKRMEIMYKIYNINLIEAVQL